MPIYEYICSQCENKFEIMRKISELDNPVSCKYCQSMKTKRRISPCNTSIKGKSPANKGCGCCSGGSCSNCHH